MPTQIALLRAVNVGGKNAVAMADLRQLAEGLGGSSVATLLQSGNLVFDLARPKGADLERLLEREAGARLGLATDFFVRTATEWDQVVRHNPFPEEAAQTPTQLVVVVLKQPVQAQAVARLRDRIVGPERIHAEGAQLYAHYPQGQGRSKLTIALMEKHLATRGTARNWNTVLKLQTLAAGPRG
ncbi:MAG TPA: DUF1697 domain-containing protein [Gemmatales bacterium]|mgnify:CR=1 FL=1|nr:DUF1697 domain-containing protein [Gemmatales bacterium]HMP57955.1 DUF1697 domain-containing protein [Gemmatales bacterium]